MLKEKNRNSIRYYISFFLVLTVILAIGLVAFYPRLSSTFVAQKRQGSWQQFEQKLKTENRVDPRAYWEFREFFSLGNFSFSGSGLNRTTIDMLLQSMNAPLKEAQLNLPFLIYTSPRLTSLDTLVTSKYLDLIVNPKDIQSQTEFKGKNFVVLKDGLVYTLIFLLPISEMEKANGYYDYREPKIRNMLKFNYWLNITQIKL